MKMRMSAAALTAAWGLFVAAGAYAGGPNLVQNGDFTQYTTAVSPSQYAGFEFDYIGNYGAVTDWASNSGSGVYNLYFFGPHASGPNDNGADPWNVQGRYTSYEPQHMNVNFAPLNSSNPPFIGLDGDPNFTGPLTQAVSGLVPGHKYELSFYWAGGELSNRTGYNWVQLTGSLGGDPFATEQYFNTNPSGTPGSFSGWELKHYDFAASATSEVLSFLAVGSPAANLPPFALLDGVSLTSVPEPSTWALLGVGFAALGFAGYRRAATLRKVLA